VTKDQLQKELKEKVKEGVKPSYLKKLKRSKSDGDISHQREKNLDDLKVKNLELEKQLEQTTQALSELTKIHQDNPPSYLLQEQLKEKQQQIEELRQQREETNSKLTETLTELDNSLIARAESVKQFGKVYDKVKDTELQLLQTEDEATDDIIRQDNEISNLRNENRRLKLTNQSLQKDLQLAERLAELRKNPLSNENEVPWLSPAISLFLVIWFISLLNSSWRKYHFKDNN